MFDQLYEVSVILNLFTVFYSIENTAWVLYSVMLFVI